MFWRRRNDDGPSSNEDLVLEQLSAYLDGELTDAEQAAVEALIARDDAAADVLDDLRLMRSAFGALGEVRAPRSFAIPAGAASAPRPVGTNSTMAAPVALFRRTEMFMRASAAAAALFFVVAVVNDPGSQTPVSQVAFESVQTSMAAPEDARTGPAFEPLRSTEEGAGGGTAGLAAPAPASAPVPAAATLDDDTPASDGDAQNGTMGVQAADAAADAGESGLAADPAGSALTQSGEELRPLPAGTKLFDDSSQSAGGMVYGLGALAALLTALSALTAWTRRSNDQTR